MVLNSIQSPLRPVANRNQSCGGQPLTELIVQSSIQSSVFHLAKTWSSRKLINPAPAGAGLLLYAAQRPDAAFCSNISPVLIYALRTSRDLWPVCFITTYSGTPFRTAWLTWPERKL